MIIKHTNIGRVVLNSRVAAVGPLQVWINAEHTVVTDKRPKCCVNLDIQHKVQILQPRVAYMHITLQP